MLPTDALLIDSACIFVCQTTIYVLRAMFSGLEYNIHTLWLGCSRVQAEDSNPAEIGVTQARPVSILLLVVDRAPPSIDG